MQLGIFLSLVPMSKTRADACPEPVVSWLTAGGLQACSHAVRGRTWMRALLLHWILAVCNVYWIFKTVYLTFFYNTGDSHMVSKKKKLCFFPSLFTLTLNYTFLPSPHAACCPGVPGSVPGSPFINALRQTRAKVPPSSMGQIRFPRPCVYMQRTASRTCVHAATQVKVSGEEEKPHETEEIGHVK